MSRKFLLFSLQSDKIEPNTQLFAPQDHNFIYYLSITKKGCSITGIHPKGDFMKKFAASILAILCATAFSFAQQNNQTTDTAVPEATPSSEQTTGITPKKNPISIGIGASFIYGNFWGFEGLKNDDMDAPTGFGGEFGVKVRFIMIEGLHFIPEISFRIFNLDHEDEGFTRYYDQTFLDFTFNMRGLITNSLYLEVGPQISINTSSEITDGEDEKFKEKIEQSTVELGLNIGVGYFITKNFSLGFRWYMGFNELFPDTKYYFDDDFNIKEDTKGNWSLINLKGAHTMMFKFGVTYWFI